MSRFESGSLSNRGRNVGQLPTTPLQNVGLAVPGLDVPPPVTQRSDFASSLLATFGLVDRIGGTLANGVERQLGYERQVIAAQEYASDQARMDAERNRRAAEGAGIKEAAKLAPIIAAELANDTTVRSPEETQAYIEQRIRRGLDGLDPVSIDAGVSSALPSLTGVGVNAVQALRDKATKDVVENLMATAATSNDVAKLAEQVNAADPRISVENARQSIVEIKLKYAAIQGDAAAFDATVASAGVPVDDNRVALYKSQLDSVVRQRESQAAEDAIQRWSAIASTIGYDRAVEAMKADKTVKPTTIATFEDRAAQQQSQAIAAVQESAYNATAQAVFKGRYDAEAMMAELDRRSNPEVTKPTSPDFLSAAQYNQLANTVRSQQKIDTDGVFVGSVIDASMKGTGSLPVLTSTHDSAFLNEAAKRGLVLGEVAGDGFKLAAVANPLRMASVMSSVNRVPQQVEAAIVSGFSSPDPAQRAYAMANYAAIYVNSPALAQSINLNKQQSVHARYLMSRLATDKSVFATNESLIAAASAMASDTLRYDESLDAVPDRDIVSKVVGVKPNDTQWSSSVRAKIADTVEKAVKENPSVGVYSGIASNRLSRSIGVASDVVAVPDNVSATVEKYVAEEYRYWRSNPQLSEQQVIDNAVAAASNRVMHEHQPTSWGGVVRFGRRGELGVDGRMLKDEVAKVIDADTAESLWRDTVPVYSPTPDGRAAWAFVQAGVNGVVYATDRSGKPIRVSLKPIKVESTAAAIEAARKRREETKTPPVTNMLIGPGVR